ncbi:MAG: hypothetical protein IPG45_10885 [Deltaproteobacteria bacterium]|nr:hypothetical protein [Deltaproteobacteria bacterium]
MGRRKKSPPPFGLGVFLVLAAAAAGYGLVAWLIGAGRPVQVVGWGPPLARPDLEWSSPEPAIVAPTPAPELEEAPLAILNDVNEGPFRPLDRPRTLREIGPTTRSRVVVQASTPIKLPTPRKEPPALDEPRTTAHDEALNLLAALEGLSRTPDPQLEPNLEALRNLPASDPRVEVTRERCATAFSDYLASARSYQQAERGLEGIDVGRPSRAVVERVSEELRQAEAQVARAARSKALCFAGARSMIAAFPPVRRETVGLAP